MGNGVTGGRWLTLPAVGGPGDAGVWPCGILLKKSQGRRREKLRLTSKREKLRVDMWVLFYFQNFSFQRVLEFYPLHLGTLKF